jgi:hypothetical protein
MSIVKSLLQKLAGAPFALGTSWLPHGEHVTRYYMYRELGAVLNESENGFGKRVLSISHSGRLARYLRIEKANIVEANYPEYSAVDLKAFRDEEFDYYQIPMIRTRAPIGAIRWT